MSTYKLASLGLNQFRNIPSVKLSVIKVYDSVIYNRLLPKETDCPLLWHMYRHLCLYKLGAKMQPFWSGSIWNLILQVQITPEGTSQWRLRTINWTIRTISCSEFIFSLFHIWFTLSAELVKKNKKSRLHPVEVPNQLLGAIKGKFPED